MFDDRVWRLANSIIESTKIAADDTVLITAPPLARPLIEAVFLAATQKGAYPISNIEFASTQEIWLTEATDLQLAGLPKVLEHFATHTDVHITMHAPENVRAFDRISLQRLALADFAWSPVMEHVAAGHTRWMLCHYPTPALAQEAGLPLREYEDRLLAASTADLFAIRARLEHLSHIFDQAREVEISGQNASLRFSLSGRAAVLSEGTRQLPDGEIFVAPLEESLEGDIFFDLPVQIAGTPVEGIHLTFKGGRVVEAGARRGQDLLHEALDADEGARSVGEFGLGVNPAITEPFGGPLIDRKMDGMCHITLGAPHPETGGTNASTLRLDLFKDLNQEGELRVDDRPVDFGRRPSVD